MPIILKMESPEGQSTAVWKITETLSDLLKKVVLSEEDKTTLNLFKNESRKSEWLSVRALLQELRSLHPIIKYKENGKPYLTDNSEQISISHSGTYIAIALRHGNTPGVDIEQVHPRIKKIAERFVGENEKTFTDQNNIEQLCILWAVKEVLYKIHPEGMLSFKNNLFVSPFILADKGSIEGMIKTTKGQSKHKLSYTKIDNYILVYTD